MKQGEVMEPDGAAGGLDLRHVRFAGWPTPAKPRLLRLRPVHAPSVTPAAPAHGTPVDEFMIWLLAQAGLDAAKYRPEAFQRRLPACLRALKVRTTAEARSLLQRRPELAPAALRALLIGVTEFFRDPPVFEFVRTSILPRLAAQPGELRIWSAACSNGAELRTIAILLAEAGLLGRSRLLGTDCRADAIAEAAAGMYDEHHDLRGLPPALRARFFRPEGRWWRMVLPEEGHMAWKVADVLTSVPAGPWDLVLCRNIVIYLEAGAAARLWQNLTAALRPGGVLVCGKADRPPATLGLRQFGPCVYGWKGEKTPGRETG